MKRLILVRHGKSSWEYDLPDDKRPLKKRGINDANLVSDLFQKKNIAVDIVISSPAVRAFSTCKIFRDKLELDSDNIETNIELYDFHGENVIKTVKNTPDNFETLMIFGHNHAFTSISNIFGNKFIDNLPTSGLVAIEFQVDSWVDIKKGNTVLTIFPRDYK